MNTPWQRPLAVLVLIGTLIHAPVVESGDEAHAFDQESGLIDVSVRDLVVTEPNAGRYGLRIWRFTADERELKSRFRALGMRRMDHGDAFDVAISRLADLSLVALIADDRPAPTKTSWHNAWGVFRWFPPYAQTWVACYPKEGSFGFRVAYLEAADGESQTITFAALDAATKNSEHTGCQNSNSSFRMIMAEILQPTIHSSLPYPYAQREFESLISTTVVPKELRFHGIFYVDGSYFFRFKATEADFRHLLSEHQLQPVGAAEIDRPGHVPEWWVSEQGEPRVDWHQGCAVIGSNPIRVLAGWDEGEVYWYTDGLLSAGVRSACPRWHLEDL